jgi:acyl-CoA thioester hydrolase
VTGEFDQPYRGGFVGHEHHFALTVYFEDTDTAGIVYYANYLKFMERARSDMLRAAGIDQRAELESSGSAYAVADVAIKYRKPAYLGEDLMVVSTIEAVRAASVTIHQRVMRGPELVTDASSRPPSWLRTSGRSGSRRHGWNVSTGLPQRGMMKFRMY